MASGRFSWQIDGIENYGAVPNLKRFLHSLAILGLLGACADISELVDTPLVSITPQLKVAEVPEVAVAESAPVRASWDHKPQSKAWTSATLMALETHGAALVNVVPADIDRYCPAYPEADPQTRKAFWVNMLSALAKHESTWQPRVSGGGGRWHGLLQISPGTARGYGCKATSSEALKDGSANLACAVRIMAVTVPRDRVISRGMRGIAADWGPFHQMRKRADMQELTRAQPYCKKAT